MEPAEPRLINYNKYLYGPGPVYRRKKTGFGSMPPRRGFSIMMLQGIALGVATVIGYKVFISDPYFKTIDDYYKEHPDGI